MLMGCVRFAVAHARWAFVILPHGPPGSPTPAQNTTSRRRVRTELGKTYASAAERDSASWTTDKGRARDLLRHLGAVQAERLSLRKVDAYRDTWLKERTRRGWSARASSHFPRQCGHV